MTEPSVTPARVRRIETLDEAMIESLADVMIDCVAGGASIGFMNPLSRDKAKAFWRSMEPGIRDGQRLFFVAEDEVGVLGTVQVVFAASENQPHRADVAKMQVHSRARGRGTGAALLSAAEEAAQAAGKTVLLLDTVPGTAAERLYKRMGWQEAGIVPDYALWPDGGLTATMFLYKLLK